MLYLSIQHKRVLPERRMESRRAGDRKPAGCFQICQLTASVAVVMAAIILVVRVCLFMIAKPDVDPSLLASEKEQQCEDRHCDSDAIGQDPRCGLCPAGWLWWRHRCYFFSEGIQEQLGWEESAEFCRRHNSSLVVIEDPAEMDFLQCVRKRFSHSPFLWVGLTDTREEGQWVWVDGSDLQRYMPLTVDWDTDHTDCADLRGSRSLFAVSCESYGPWICKKDSTGNL